VTRILLILALLFSASAHAETMTVRYEGVAYGVLTFGRARLEASRESGRYEAAGQLETAGLAALFTTASARAKAHGIVGDGRVKPLGYELHHVHRGAVRDWLIDWTGDPVRVRSVPDIPYQGEAPVSEAQRRAGADPISTLVSMGAQVAHSGSCAGTFRIFDGLYVYDMMLREKTPGRYRRGSIDLPVVRCAIRQKRVAGYTYRADLEKELPEAEIWFAQPPGAPFGVMVRFASRLPLGLAVISMTDFRTAP
jgi:hypothetical protein